MSTLDAQLGTRSSALTCWNATDAEYPRDVCAHEMFESWVARAPDATALVVGAERLSYRELDYRANQIARYLQRRGVGPGSYVGICMHRSVQMIVSMLGVLKAGGAYVPLDASYPERRLAEMLSGLRLQMLLVCHGVRSGAHGAATSVVNVDEISDELKSESRDSLPRSVTPQDLAYLVFTSGSTGKAKAAKVTQRGWTNLLHWFRETYAITSTDRVLVVSSFCFDITQRSIMMPLVAGGELHLLASKHFEPELTLRSVRGERITIINSAPSMFYPILEWPAREDGVLRSLRWVFLGGEPIAAARLKAWAKSSDCRASVVNVYGVAECTDVSSAYTLVDYERYSTGSVPLGRPIFNSRIYLLDEDDQEVAPGEVGEICIGGDGVGFGYDGDEALTKRKFVPDRFAGVAGAQLYRTGDLGRIGDDWNLEYRGRIDHQVKIAGVRIELGDVEAALRCHPAVKDAVVITTSSTSEQGLVAFVIGKADVDATEFRRSLRDYLKERLPSPMLPSRIELIAAMPLTPNGKVDRRALAQWAAADQGRQ